VAVAPTATPKPQVVAPTPTPRSAPPPPPAEKPRALPPEIVRGNPAVPAIAITFDAGAGAAPTAQILDVLAARGIKLTFFLTGKWVDQNPALAQRIAAEGHEIANHSYNHPDFTKLAHEEMVEEINSTERTIQRVAGVSSRPWFRFPFGARNAATRGVVADLGYTSVFWTLDSLDSVNPPKTPQFIYERVVNNAANGSIILVHVGSAPTAEALPRILDTLTERGFRIVTVSELVS
jgi:peptidoglycan/xylan/chitin deacetylase (PgdA/CDA1 family)